MKKIKLRLNFDDLESQMELISKDSAWKFINSNIGKNYTDAFEVSS